MLKNILEYAFKTELFINYFDNHARNSPINIAVARVLLGFVAIWRLTIVEWSEVKKWPVYGNEYHLFLIPSEEFLAYLTIEKYVTTLFLILFILGYRIKLVGFVSAFLLGHMSGILYMINHLHESTFFSPIIILIILFGLFSQEDMLSIDNIRRMKWKSAEKMNRDLQKDKKYQAQSLKWCLIVFGIFWFMTGFSKIIYGPFYQWVFNFNLLFKHYQMTQVPPDAWIRIGIGNLLIWNYWLSVLAGTLAILLEISVLVVILVGLSITPIILATMGFIITIAITMNPFFFELLILPFLFSPWDKLYSKVASDEKIAIMYDGQNKSHIKLLQVAKYLDINDTIQFDKLNKKDSMPDRNGIYVVRNGGRYSGYWAIREILKQYRIFSPITFTMNIDSVANLCQRIYNHRKQT